MEVTWKDDSKKYENDTPAFDCYPRSVNVRISEDDGKTFLLQNYDVPETDEQVYIAQIGGKKIKPDHKYVVHA